MKTEKQRLKRKQERKLMHILGYNSKAWSDRKKHIAERIKKKVLLAKKRRLQKEQEALNN